MGKPQRLRPARRERRRAGCDGDGASNLAEFLAGTHPTDTDGDGTGDASDAFPADPSEWADFDSDGTGDNADLDDDDDGMPDAWESLYGFDPLDPSDASADPDADELDNLGEFTAGTDPLKHNGYTEVGIWSLDEGAGVDIGDDSGLGHHGTFAATPTQPTWVPGRYGSALHFDHSGARVEIPDSDILDLTEAFTLAAWVKPGMQETQSILKKTRYKYDDGFELSLSGSSGVAFVRINQATNANTYKLFATTPYPFDGATWMHLAATFDGEALAIYVNGVLEGTLPTPEVLVAANAVPITIGAEDDSDVAYDGAIDEVRLYDRALDVDELQLVLAGLPSSPTPMATVWGTTSTRSQKIPPSGRTPMATARGTTRTRTTTETGCPTPGKSSTAWIR